MANLKEKSSSVTWIKSERDIITRCYLTNNRQSFNQIIPRPSDIAVSTNTSSFNWSNTYIPDHIIMRSLFDNIPPKHDDISAVLNSQISKKQQNITIVKIADATQIEDIENVYREKRNRARRNYTRLCNLT